MEEIYSKAVASIQSEDDDQRYGPDGGFTAILSSPSQDRDGDSLLRKEWMEPLPKSLTLDADHGMSIATTIGSFKPYFEGDELMMEARFSSLPRAQDVRTLIKEGHVRNVSVAFLTDKSKKSGQARRELLNAGVVAVPANRDAVILDSKALDERAQELALEKLDKKDAATIYIKVTPVLNVSGIDKILEEAKAVVEAQLKAGTGDAPALTQAIHDAAIHLGAICFPLETDEDETGASEGANKSFTLEEIKPEGMTMESFEQALTECLTRKSPVESPAAVEETPAADDAADDAQRVRKLGIEKKKRSMRVRLYPSTIKE